MHRVRLSQNKRVAYYHAKFRYQHEACTKIINDYIQYFGSVVEWLNRRACDQHGLGSKHTRAILLRPWERHFTAHSPAW